MYKPNQGKGNYCELYFSLPAKEYIELVNKFYKDSETIYLDNKVLKTASEELNRLLQNF